MPSFTSTGSRTRFRSCSSFHKTRDTCFADLPASPAGANRGKNPMIYRNCAPFPLARFLPKAAMREKPITQDAQLLLRLEHLRNESEMGGAINFGRKTANDYLKIDMAHGTDESRWLRQVVTYWGMAASSVLDSRLGREGFSQSQVFSRNIHSFLEGTTVARGPAQTHPKSGFHGQCGEGDPEVGGHSEAPCTRVATPGCCSRETRLNAADRKCQNSGTDQFDDRHFPAAANSCNPTANCSLSTGTQYTTRARDLKFPSSDRTFNRSFGFHGLLVKIRAPRGLMFSVTPSCAGVRTSRLERSTFTFIGVRFSVRFEAGSIRARYLPGSAKL